MCYKCNKKDVGSLDVEIGKSVNSILQGAFFLLLPVTLHLVVEAWKFNLVRRAYARPENPIKEFSKDSMSTGHWIFLSWFYCV